MYIIECIIKWLFPKEFGKEFDYDPLRQDNLSEDADCQHEFLPVDSTGEILACIKCGFIVKRKEMKDTEG